MKLHQSLGIFFMGAAIACSKQDSNIETEVSGPYTITTNFKAATVTLEDVNLPGYKVVADYNTSATGQDSSLCVTNNGVEDCTDDFTIFGNEEALASVPNPDTQAGREEQLRIREEIAQKAFMTKAQNRLLFSPKFRRQ